MIYDNIQEAADEARSKNWVVFATYFVWNDKTKFQAAPLHHYSELDGWEFIPNWRDYTQAEDITMSTYQHVVEFTSGAYGEGRDRQIMSALAIVGEVGELANKIKKKFTHGHEISDADIAVELGDILWYVAELSSAFKIHLADIAIGNIEKLRERYPNGFSQERSINREA